MSDIKKELLGVVFLQIFNLPLLLTFYKSVIRPE